MSDKRQWWLPEIRETHVKRGDARDLLTHTHGLALPKIVNGRMTPQQTVDVKCTGSRAKVPTHFPPLPVRAVATQEVKKLSTCFSASRLGFERLPTIPAESSNKDGPLSQGRLMPVRLPPLGINTKSSSSSSSCRPKSRDLHRPPCKLPPSISERKEKLEKKQKKHKMLPDAPRAEKAKKKKKKKKKKKIEYINIRLPSAYST